MDVLKSMHGKKCLTKPLRCLPLLFDGSALVFAKEESKREQAVGESGSGRDGIRALGFLGVS